MCTCIIHLYIYILLYILLYIILYIILIYIYYRIDTHGVHMLSPGPGWATKSGLKLLTTQLPGNSMTICRETWGKEPEFMAESTTDHKKGSQLPTYKKGCYRQEWQLKIWGLISIYWDFWWNFIGYNSTWLGHISQPVGTGHLWHQWMVEKCLAVHGWKISSSQCQKYLGPWKHRSLVIFLGLGMSWNIVVSINQGLINPNFLDREGYQISSSFIPPTL